MEILKQTRSGIVTKWLVGFAAADAAEVVLIERPGKNIVCFSTMVGCPVGCGFCASGVVGLYKRKLSSSEMDGMIAIARRHALHPGRPWVVSAMGEGEPGANIDNVLETLDRAIRSPADKLALSTSAPTAAMLAKTLNALASFARDHAVEPKLQYSLHAARRDERNAMFRPGHLEPADALRALSHSGYRNIEINVTLIEGRNDSEPAAEAIGDVLDPDGPWSVKLNRFNAFEGDNLCAASPAAYEHIQRLLTGRGHSVEYYETDGQEIAAACGQLHFDHAQAAKEPPAPAFR